MKVLDTLLDVRTPLKLEEICVSTGLPKSTAFRIVVNVLEGQYLVETDEGYWLGLKLLRFGALVEERSDLRQQERSFLTELREIFSRKYAVDEGEYEASVRCVAAPIRDSTGRVIAAVSISGRDTRRLSATRNHAPSRSRQPSEATVETRQEWREHIEETTHDDSAGLPS